MSSHSLRGSRPTLRDNVDVQLHSAFNDRNWPSVIRLAEKRAKSLKDPYYEAVRVAAESQLDGPAEKCAALVAVDGLVRKGTVVNDLQTLDLYDWACESVQDDSEYAGNLGILRLRWVKANPRSADGAQCLRACLIRWDLVNAQQIAASLDKSLLGSGDRRHHFWSILLTYLLSISLQCHPSKRKIYGLLAAKQLERAAELTESSEKEDNIDRGIRTEEELILCYRVLAACGTQDEFLKKIQSPKLGVMKHFAQGRKQLFMEALSVLETWEQWDIIYELCAEALNRDDEDGTPSFLGSDWRVWRAFITAATYKANDQEAFGKVQDILARLIAIKSKIARMYSMTLGLALLETAFRMPETLLPSTVLGSKLTPRLAQLCLYIDQNFSKSAIFEDVKPYVAELSFEEAEHFVQHILPKLMKDGGEAKAVSVRVLQLKFRYLLTTCPQTLTHVASVVHGKGQLCKFCSKLSHFSCDHCLKAILEEAVATYKDVSDDPKRDILLSQLEKDPLLDLSMVIGISLLKLSGLQQTSRSLRASPLEGTNSSRVLQALLVLDHQLQQSPNDIPLRILVVHLYLLVGCASRAHQVWTPMDVKRMILDSLGPLLFDRICSISPALFHGSKSFSEPLRNFYASATNDRAPTRVWDAFSAGSYSSILDIVDYDDKLRRSCTMVMSLVEERRATRAAGGKVENDIQEASLVSDITDDTVLVNATDYGSFPNLEGPFGDPLHELIRIGPPLSNERGHLSLLTEQYLDLISFKIPKEYKPSRANEAAVRDRDYLTESLARIHTSLTNFLHRPETPSKLTGPEYSYYTAILLLSATLLVSFSTPRTEPIPPTFARLTKALKTALASLRATFLNLPSHTTPSRPALFFALADPHTLSTLRDMALAIKHSATYVLTFQEKEAARDRAGKSILAKEVVAEMRALEALSSKAVDDVKERIKMLKEKLGEGGWLDRLSEWTFGKEGEEAGVYEDEVARSVFEIAGERAGVDEWAAGMVESWREGVKGLGMVRME